MTNLRRKAKLAKSELEKLNRETPGSTYEILEKVKRANELSKLIAHKTKPNSYDYENVNKGLNYNNLTYLSIRVDMKEIARKVSPNGRKFSEQEVDEFLKKGIIKIVNHASKVSQMSIEDKKPSIVHYVLYSSESRTKQKEIVLNYLYKQNIGEDLLYPYVIDNEG